MQLGEHERAGCEQRARPLHEMADRPAGPPEVRVPVRLRPHLEPVDAEPGPRARERGARREQREEREGAGVHHVVAPAVAEQVAQHAPAEAQRRPDPPVPVVPVERLARGDRDHLDALDPGRVVVVPLAPREVGDLVAGRDELGGEVAVPALGAADRPRVQAVVEDADPHEARLP
jgi:hypothetical protein